MSVSRQDLKGRAQTVTGIVSPDDLGNTLMHEHVLCDIRPPDWRARGGEDVRLTLSNHWPINYGEVEEPGNLILQAVDVAVFELAKMRDEGGQSVVELSCGGLNPNPKGLVSVAEQSDVHIIMGCGHYVDEYQDAANKKRSVDSFAEEMIAQIFEGAWGTDIRAGIIGEIGCQTPWTDMEKEVMAGALLAMQETGASLSVHPGRQPDQPQEVMEFIATRGVDTSRVIMSHVDRTIFDSERLFRLADTGCIIEFDLFGMETTYYKWAEDVDMPNDGVRLKWIRKLIERGHLSQILISHDICYRTRLSSFGGHGYGHIFRNVVPIMRRRGFTEDEINTILVGTPKRLLTFV